MQTTIDLFGILYYIPSTIIWRVFSRLWDGQVGFYTHIQYASSQIAIFRCRAWLLSVFGADPFIPLFCPHLKSVLEIGCHLRHFSLGNLPCAAADAATTPNYCFTNYMLSCLICSINRILQERIYRSCYWDLGLSISSTGASNYKPYLQGSNAQWKVWRKTFI